MPKGKRSAAGADTRAPKKKPEDTVSDNESLYEDRYGDDIEEEEAPGPSLSEDDDEQGLSMTPEKHAMADEAEGDEAKVVVRSYRPNVDALGEEEELTYDPLAYDMYHQCEMEWSCYSVDFQHDQLGACRREFPHQLHFVAGTQVESREELRKRPLTQPQERNRLYVAKCSRLGSVRRDDEDEENVGPAAAFDLEGGDDDDAPPLLESIGIKHQGAVNQVRACPQAPRLVATWSSAGMVFIWDVQQQLDDLQSSLATAREDVVDKAPAFKSGDCHTDEGYAMDWNPEQLALFCTGSCDRTVRIWRPAAGGVWELSAPLKDHKGSVESVKWRPKSCDQLASACTDGKIRIWDLRKDGKKPCIIFTAHDADVNCIGWCPLSENVLLSGGDEGAIKAWDDRMPGTPLVHMTYHKKPITALDWHPVDAAVFAVASEDDSVTIWDMSVEAADPTLVSPNDTPSQMLFQHMGQKHISDIRWHPQITGAMISTAESGINIFKTISA